MTDPTINEAARRVTVRFAGGRGGEETLTWAQRLMWRAAHLMGDSQAFLNCPWILPVYGTRDLDTVLTLLAGLIERYEALRTTFADTPDGPVQRVARTGQLTVEIVEAGEERGMRVADRLSRELSRRIFSHAVDLPLRCAVVLKNGRPVALAFTFSHLAIDIHALGLLTQAWKALLRGEDPLPATWHPLDQAVAERENSQRARSARSIEYWRSVLKDVPLDVFDHAPSPPEDPRFIEVGMESVAVAAAAERLAARWTLSTTSVLLAACATVLTEVSGRRRAVMQLVHSNRRDPRTQTMVGAVGQDGLFVLDLPDGDFAATCRATYRSALRAYRFASYDPFAMQAMREEIGRRRGREPDLDAFFNDRRTISDWPDLPHFYDDEDLTPYTEKTRTFTTNAWPGVRFKAFFTVGNATDTAELGLIVDTAYLPRDRARAMLLDVEALLVRSL